jgi:hypothetical protein
LRRSFNRGGNYNNPANGFASFNGNNARSNANGNIGFRSALPSSQMLQGYGPAPSTDGDKGICFLGQGFLEEKSLAPKPLRMHRGGQGRLEWKSTNMCLKGLPPLKTSMTGTGWRGKISVISLRCWPIQPTLKRTLSTA